MMLISLLEWEFYCFCQVWRFPFILPLYGIRDDERCDQHDQL